MMLGCMTLFAGCGKDRITNRKIPSGDVKEFYYTVENINYDAFYQRYRFYKEDGKLMFQHETREKPGAYGPATENDVTDSGTLELSNAEWKAFLAYLKDGTVSARKDSAESGGSGPWTFIYWKNDKGKYQVFEFSNSEVKAQFVAYCAALAGGERIDDQEENVKGFRIERICYSPGYGDMRGGYHEVVLKKDDDGNWTYVTSDRETHDQPTVTATYAVSKEAVAELEAFIEEKKILSLESRSESDMFATDYSPWSWSIDYEKTSFGKTKQEYCRFGEYQRYSDRDYELLNELKERFTAVRGEKISEKKEKR